MTQILLGHFKNILAYSRKKQIRILSLNLIEIDIQNQFNFMLKKLYLQNILQWQMWIW